MASSILHHAPQIHKACQVAYRKAPEGDEAVRLELTQQDFA
jgi:hypothetical protein